MIVLILGSWILISTLAFSLLQYVVLVEVYEESLFHTSVTLEKGGVFEVFSFNGGHSSLTLYQNLTSGSFLNVSCNVQFETLSISFSYSVTLKNIGLSCTLNGSFTPVPSSIGHFENTVSPHCADLPNVDILYYEVF